MRFGVAALGTLLFLGATMPGEQRTVASHARADRIAPNDNRAPAGVLSNGVLTVHLEAREGEWHPDRDTDPGLVVRAFGEEGKPLQIPGPLIRVLEGTQIRAFVRNTLRDSVLTVRGLSDKSAATRPGSDTIQIKPGEVREVRFTASTPGTYYYRGATNDAGTSPRGSIDAELVGAFVVDPRSTSGGAKDRI